MMNLNEFEDYCKDRLPNLGYYHFEIGYGWQKLILPLLAYIDEFNTNNPACPLTIYQVKEKFGMLRFYSTYTPALEELIHSAEKKSKNTCQMCGQRGKIVCLEGWEYCLCKKCRGE